MPVLHRLPVLAVLLVLLALSLRLVLLKVQLFWLTGRRLLGARGLLGSQ